MALVDSDSVASAITVTFGSSGEWGSGTGDIIPRQRMLNGLIYANQGTTGTITFNNVPAGSHSVLVYTVGVPLQFQDQDYTITGLTSQSVYTTQMNADQYNPNPTWVRGTSPDPSIRTLANYVVFQNVQPAANGTIRLNWSTPTAGFDRGVAVNAVQLLINPPAIAEPPQLVLGPQPTESLQGANVVLNVLATGDGLTYRWRKDGQNLSDLGTVSGSETDQLTIRSFQPGDTGFYSVLVENAGGSIVTEAVKVKVVDADRTITGPLIAHFKFDETSGTTAANTGSDAINGTLFTAAWAPGKLGGAYTEVSIVNAVLVTNYTKIQEEVTVSAWVKLDPNLIGIGLSNRSQRERRPGRSRAARAVRVRLGLQRRRSAQPGYESAGTDCCGTEHHHGARERGVPARRVATRRLYGGRRAGPPLSQRPVGRHWCLPGSDQPAECRMVVNRGSLG